LSRARARREYQHDPTKLDDNCSTIDVSNLNFEFAIVPKRFNLTMTDIITSVQIGIPFYLFM